MTKSPASRRPLLVALALAATLLAGACGSGSTPASDTSTTTAASTTKVPPSSTSSTVSSSHCRTENLRGSLGATDSGAGQRYVALVLTNTGTAPCELRGFPGVSLLDAAGTQMGAAAVREGATGSTVSIGPGGTASATLHTSTAGTGGECTGPSTRLRVYPPDNTVALEFAAAYTACGSFTVTALVAGSAGR